MKKRILAIALALAMLLPVFAVGSFAATPEEQAQALLDQTSAIFESRKFTLKAHCPSLYSNKTVSLVFVGDGDRTAFETTMEWVAMSRQLGGINAMLSGWFLQLLFGSRVRYIAEPDQSTMVFLNRRIYAEIPETPELDPYYFATLFDVPERTATTVSEPVIGGKKYLCATLDADEYTTSYYYLNGTLKRIGMEALNPETGQTETFVFEIDLLSPTADQSYFNTNWMLKLSSLFNMILPF